MIWILLYGVGFMVAMSVGTFVAIYRLDMDDPVDAVASTVPFAIMWPAMLVISVSALPAVMIAKRLAKAADQKSIANPTP